MVKLSYFKIGDKITLMSIYIPAIKKFNHSHICYECDEKGFFEGRIFYCERCAKSYFVCNACLPIYLKYAFDSELPMNKYTTKTKREFK